jgi:hypothetical protein
MATLAVKTIQNSALTKQHQAVHGHMRYLVSAVGKLDLQSCLPHIAASSSLKNRIALYRWSLNDFKKAIERDTDLDKEAFHKAPVLKSILKENQAIIEQIKHAAVLAENALKKAMLREELNVVLVKINLAVNSICETIEMKMVREDSLAKSL